MATPESEGFIRSFARGLAVIEAMGRSGTHTVATLAVGTGLPRSVVKRALLTLCELGYAVADDKNFRLTPKVLTLGMTYLTSLPFWGHAQRVLEDLCAAVGESCAMAVFDGHEAVYVLRIPSRKIMSLRLGMGSRLPAYATSPGRMLLAWQPQEMVAAYIRDTEFKAYTPTTLRDSASLLQSLDDIRSTGYAWVDGEFDSSVCGLSVPIKDERGMVVAAITVNLLSGQTSQEQALKDFLIPLRHAAQELSGMAPSFLGAGTISPRTASAGSSQDDED
jgi:IclR family pca regulon transcriptional regulator